MSPDLKKPSLKKFFVALDRPGSGWSCVIRARTEKAALRAATRKFREQPNTIYEVPQDFEKTQEEEREQAMYDELSEGSLLIALELTGVLPKVTSDFPNSRMLRAIRKNLDLLMENEWEVSRVKELLSRDPSPRTP